MGNDNDLFNLDADEWEYCCMCGDELQCGEPYYIYEGEKYCPYCAINCDIVDTAIEVDYTL